MISIMKYLVRIYVLKPFGNEVLLKIMENMSHDLFNLIKFYKNT